MNKEYLKSLKDLWERIERLEGEIDERIEEVTRSYLGEKLRFPEIFFERKFPSFERITINKKLPNNSNERINKVRYLHNPPPKFINSYGRANYKNQSIFYATFLTPIALKELKPEKGDLYTLSRWKLLNKYDKLLVFPIFKPEKVDNDSLLQSLDIFETKRATALSMMLTQLLDRHEEDKNVIFELFTFIANCFAKKIAPQNNSFYVFTSSIANNIFNMSEKRVEAITYPTVQDSTQIENIALKPTVVREKYALDEVREYRVIDYSGDRILSEYIGRSSKFIGGNIIWP